MGACASAEVATKESRDKARAIERQHEAHKQRDSQIKKLLLLGAGESGKSTLFKQMISIYGNGYSREDLIGYTNIVFNNTIAAMKTLVEESDNFAQYEDQNFAIRPENFDSKKRLHECKLDDDIDLNLAKHITILWGDPGIQLTYENRAKFQLGDSASYFFSRVMEIGKPDYVPNEQDVLRCRVRTTGIVETSFEIEGTQFRMFDVGGQRNERKKWIHCFENVTCVIFVAAISEYDQVLYEDETTNRMMEALDLFDEICNSRWFRDTSIILFLNKRDLFEIKIETVPLSVCFENYNQPQTDPKTMYDEGCRFLQEQFEDRNRTKTKEIYTQITCATDANNIEHVFNAVKDIVIRQSLREGGLMM